MNLLITGAWQGALENIQKLESMGHNVCFVQQEKDKLPCDYTWVEGIIGNGIFLYHDIEKFTHLKYIQLTSAGFDRVPMEYVKEHNIQIHNARGVYSIPMAEFVLASVLHVYKKMEEFRIQQKNHTWIKHRDIQELFGSTVAIIGCGSVGTECARRFKAFGCKVLGVDLYPRTDDNYEKITGLDSLKEVLKESDITVWTLPLTSQTKYVVNKERLEQCKEGSILVNIARGQIINTQDLLDYSNKFRAIILDVFEEEPLNTDNPLWEKENVYITPHNSFVGNNNVKRLNEVIFRNLKSLY